jgi:pilus assembly protein CpaF
MIPTEVYERSIRGFLAPIATLLDDERVTEVLVNGPSAVYVERGGRLTRTELSFESGDAVVSAMRVVAQYVDRLGDEPHEREGLRCG